MSGRTYLGPADEFVYQGKSYRQGDVIPMSDAEIAHHEAHQHRFGEVAPAVHVEPAKPGKVTPEAP